MEFYLKNILLFSLIVLVIALVVAVVQVILMLLDLRFVSHEIRKRAKTITDLYDAVAVLGSASWKTFIKRIKKLLAKYFKNYFGGEDDEKTD